METLITILIVDDEQTIRDGLKHLIPWEKEGFRIIGEAANGKQALELIRVKKPEIIITDLIMPEMDGLELSQVIHQQYPDSQFLILSSYDDFNYVSQSFKNGAVDYLLKPTLNPQNLLHAIKKISLKLTKKHEGDSKQQMTSQSLNRILSGYMDDFELKKIAEYLDYTTFQLVYTNAHWYQDALHVQHFLEKNDLLDTQLCRWLPFYSTNGDLGLLLATKNPPLSKKQLKTAMITLQATNPEGFFVIGDPFTELPEVSQQLRNLAQKSLGQRFYFKNIFLIDEAESFLLNHEALFNTKRFIRDILNNDFSLGIQRIEDFFNQLILSFVEPVYLKQQASSFFYTLLSTLESSYPKSTTFRQLKLSFFNELTRTDYLEDFSKVILATILKIRNELQEQKVNNLSTDELINDITFYIKKNFQKELSLSQLADAFHFSYSYLSTFFSKHFDCSFSEYVNAVRLQEAKRYLLESPLNLSEISEACGYSDLSYFSKQFKKEFGISPSRYRREKHS